MTELTTKNQPQEVASALLAAMDSVNLLNAGQPKDMADADWADHS